MAKSNPKAPKGSMVNRPNGQTRYWDAGKGSKRRESDQQKYEENWERIFGKKEKKDLDKS
tara:strand:- start:196 stop:375 length:180 start_codon:yes stop_codon:yes gene_type:complete